MKTLSKKAQVTIFIIIGVILIIAIILAMILKTTPDDKEILVPENFQSINNFIENCIQETSDNSVYQIGYEGGASFNMENPSPVSFIYFYKGRDYVPTKEEIQDEISKEIKKTFYRCAKGFEDFPDFQVDEGIMDVQTQIKDDKILVNVNYPLTITKDEKTILIENFEAEVLVRLDTIHKVILEVNKEQLRNPEAICINCINELAEQNDLYIEIYDYDEETILFMIRDEKSKINNQDFQWRFAHII